LALGKFGIAGSGFGFGFGYLETEIFAFLARLSMVVRMTGTVSPAGDVEFRLSYIVKLRGSALYLKLGIMRRGLAMLKIFKT
jgi:hypothetical protein